MFYRDLSMFYKDQEKIQTSQVPKKVASWWTLSGNLGQIDHEVIGAAGCVYI